MDRGLRRLWGLVLCMLAFAPPLHASNKHLGVSTCANSTCHAASQALPSSNILQYEYFIWRDHDKHSQAYKALQSDQGKAIASALGLPSATGAPTCLRCHSDYVPESQRGKNHKLSDGVGCEACHGGAQSWLGLHASGISTREENLANGMYPTEDPQARAELCLGCHLAPKDDVMAHKIHAAGHPRLTFELDTYSAERPAHHQVDQDYKLRKQQAYGTVAWLTGQVATAKVRLGNVAKARQQAGLFPELSHFECLGCHQSMGDGSAGTRGVPRTNDAAVQMVWIAAQALGHEAASTIDQGLSALHAAATKNAQAWSGAAADLLSAVQTFGRSVGGRNLSPAQTRAILDSLLKQAEAGRFETANQAEQATYAVGTLLYALDLDGAGVSNDAVNKAVDGLYAAAGQGMNFSARQWQQQAAGVRRALP